MHKAQSLARRAFLETGRIFALAIFCVIGAMLLLLQGCSVTKVQYEKNDKGEVSYRIYRNDHWLKTESTGLSGGMTDGGKFTFAAEGMKSSPSEEFNRTMQTYTSAFVQLAQIAAAAYNPSSSAAVSSSAKSTSAETTTPVTVNVGTASGTAATNTVTDATSASLPASQSGATATAATNGVECADCTVNPQTIAK